METFKKTLLEFGRVVLIGVVSWLLTDTVIANLVNQFGANLSLEVRLLITGGLSTIVKSIDRGLHESGMAEKGLTRF